MPPNERPWVERWLLYSLEGKRFWGEPGARPTRFASVTAACDAGSRENRRVHEARKQGHGRGPSDFEDWLPWLVHDAA